MDFKFTLDACQICKARKRFSDVEIKTCHMLARYLSGTAQKFTPTYEAFHLPATNPMASHKGQQRQHKSQDVLDDISDNEVESLFSHSLETLKAREVKSSSTDVFQDGTDVIRLGESSTRKAATKEKRQKNKDKGRDAIG